MKPPLGEIKPEEMKGLYAWLRDERVPAPLESRWFDCECSDIHHAIRIVYDPEYGDATLEFRVNNYKSFWKRLIGAFKYLFNFGNNDCSYCAMIVRKSEAEDMIKLLSKVSVWQVNKDADSSGVHNVNTLRHRPRDCAFFQKTRTMCPNCSTDWYKCALHEGGYDTQNCTCSDNKEAADAKEEIARLQDRSKQDQGS